MFSMFKRKNRPEVSTLLANQVLGGQSVLFRFFRQELEMPDSSIEKIELTYFAMSVLTRAYLSFANDTKAAETLDTFAASFLQKMHSATNPTGSFDHTVASYQRRYAEYQQLLSPIFHPPSDGKPNPSTTLLLHAFEKITRNSAKGHMVKVMAATGFIQQFVLDNIDFVKSSLENDVA